MFWISEGEIGRNGFKLFGLRFGGGFMDGISVNENSPVRPGGACMFAGTAAYANFILNLRDEQLSLVGDHLACLGGAVFGTCPACSLLGMNYAIVLNEYGFTDLCQFLGFKHEGHYRPGGAYVSTPRALVVAKPAVEIHPWLHDAGKPVFTYRRLKHVGGACIYAEGAGSAPGGKCFDSR